MVQVKKIDCGDHGGIAELGLDVKDNGKTVVFPTDTVYGLGANPSTERGVDACFEVKERDETKPLPVLFSEISKIEKFVEFDPIAESLARKFWPGGLSMVLQLKKGVSLPRKLARNHALAVRIPNHECCLELIQACGGSLIGTSANRSGETPLTDPYAVRLESFASKCDYLVRGKCFGRTSSTVISIDPKGRLEIIREGAVPSLEIHSHLERTKIADFS